MIRMVSTARILLTALAVANPLAALATDEVNVSRGLSRAGAPLAMHGYDPVAYFMQGAPARGSDNITLVHGGASYRFVNEENRKAFKSNPARYVPQFGGYCAYGVGSGKKFDGDPLMWTIHNDRVYLNLNPDVQARFAKNISDNIRKAASNWPTIEHMAVDDLQ